MIGCFHLTWCSLTACLSPNNLGERFTCLITLNLLHSFQVGMFLSGGMGPRFHKVNKRGWQDDSTMQFKVDEGSPECGSRRGHRLYLPFVRD
jgi:hypothetical protein